jgi:uncharacterized membrane protein
MTIFYTILYINTCFVLIISFFPNLNKFYAHMRYTQLYA